MRFNSLQFALNRFFACLMVLFQASGLFADGPFPPSDPRLVSIGRIDTRDKAAWKFDWSAVSIGFRFQGRDFAFLLEDGNGDFNVYVDGKLSTIWRTRKGEGRYEVSGLDEGEHRVKLVRRNEGLHGVSIFKGIDLPRGGKLLEPGEGWRKKRKIEFAGASWTTGYGNEGPGLKCVDLKPVQNAELAFPQFTADALDAEYMNVAYSGRGLVRNYGEKAKTSPEPFPAYYGRSLQADPQSKWNFKVWIPDAVVVNLGGNDYSTEPHPDTEVFIKAQEDLLKRMRKAYPKAVLVCFVSAGWPGYLPHIEVAVKRRLESGDKNVHVLTYGEFKPEEFGCDYHPKAHSHRVLAGQLAPWLREKLGWQ